MSSNVNILALRATLDAEVKRNALLYHSRVEEGKDSVIQRDVMFMAESHRVYVVGLNFALKKAADQAGFEVDDLQPKFDTADYEDIPFRR